MVRSARLVALLRPYTSLFAATVAATVVSSVLDGFTFVLLIPFLRSLFGEAALPAQGGSHVEAMLDRIAGPFLHAGAAETALRNVVIVLLVALVLKNVTAYLASYWSVVIQESVVRDLRVRLFHHLQTLPLGYFQRTRAGQTVARWINGTAQGKTAVTAALASLLQNAVVILVYVVILFGLSARLTLLALAFAPVLLFIVRPMINRLRRRSREMAAERGELTSHVSEMVASVKLIRAYVAEAFELERFKRLAERYRKRVLRAQRFSSLTSPVTEVFGGVMIVMILWVGTRLALGDPAALRPEMLITFLAVALRLMSPVKSVSNYPAVMAGAAASAERVFEVLDLPADEGDRPGETTAVFRERFEYRHVSFASGEEAEVLRAVSLAVRGGPPADPHPRRGHQPARHRIGTARSGRDRPPHAAPHGARDRAPARDRAARRSDRGARGRVPRAAWHPPRAARRRRPVPPALQPAVPDLKGDALRLHHRPQRDYAGLPDRPGDSLGARGVRRGRRQRGSLGRRDARRRRRDRRPARQDPRQRVGLHEEKRNALDRDAQGHARLPGGLGHLHPGRRSAA